MPLQKRVQIRSGVKNNGSDNMKNNDNIDEAENPKAQFDEEDEMEDKWLQSLGVDEAMIRRIHNSQVFKIIKLYIHKICNYSEIIKIRKLFI